MSDTEDNEDLKRAIALSKQDFHSSPPPGLAIGSAKEVVDLTLDSDGSSTTAGDDFDEQIRQAIALSLQDSRTNSNSVSSPPSTDKLLDGPIQPASAPSNEATEPYASEFLLDRRKLERERLERLKRKREDPVSPPPLSRDNKSTKVDKSSTILKASSGPKRQGLNSTHKPEDAAGVLYPSGAIKQTWAFGFPRRDDIKIEEVLQKKELESAVLSSFQWDIDWLFTKIDPTTTKLILVMQAKEEATVLRSLLGSVLCD